MTPLQMGSDLKKIKKKKKLVWKPRLSEWGTEDLFFICFNIADVLGEFAGVVKFVIMSNDV